MQPQKNLRQVYLVNLLIFIIICSINMPAFAHGEQLQISNQPKAVITLSDKQLKLIDLKTVKAKEQPFEQLLGLNGEVRLLPDAQADVSLRISGNVTALYANLGDKVKQHQPLIKVQSLLIGDPPPSVVVHAPMTGVIDARNVMLGQAVVPNTVLFHISDRSKINVIAKVYEEDLDKVKLGQKAIVRILSFPKLIFFGKVNLIEPNLDPLTRTVNVQISVDNPKDLLKPGMFSRTDLVLEQSKAALVIPSSAVMKINNLNFVFKREGSNFLYQQVNTGMSNGNLSQILNGLKVGDEVVTQGNRQLYTHWLTGGQSQTED